MTTILETILEHKQAEVAERRSRVSASELWSRVRDLPSARGFATALRRPGEVALIAEIKKASPSKGVIRPDFDPVSIATAYAQNGAAALSVLTDERFFQGHASFLRQAREAVSIPVLRKDFTVDPWQIPESRVMGADAILLIAAALSPPEMEELLGLASDAGLDALVEVHDARDLARVPPAATLLGINSRDLRTFHTSLAGCLALVHSARAGRPERVVVAESGIATRADVDQLRLAGVDAMLVGEALMREADVGAKVRELLGHDTD